MPKHRSLIADSEATRDPIFLLQIRRFVYHDQQMSEEGVEYDSDEECVMDLIENKRVDNDELVERELAIPYWYSESVWYSREEAEAYGNKRSYHYGKQDRDWRVYCVCAEGYLAKLLDEHSNCRDFSVRKEEGSEKTSGA